MQSFRIDQKVCYQRHMLYAIVAQMLVIFTLISVHYYFFGKDEFSANQKHVQFDDGVSNNSPVEPRAGVMMVRSFLSHGGNYKIIPDGIVSEAPALAAVTQAVSHIPIFSSNDMLFSVNNDWRGFHYKMKIPRLPLKSELRLNRGRPPSVRTRIEPFGIRNTVTIVVMIDSSGTMIPLTEHEYGAGTKIPYLLRSGSKRDAEKVYLSLSSWTFAPAWDESGRPAPARFTITHTPRR